MTGVEEGNLRSFLSSQAVTNRPPWRQAAALTTRSNRIKYGMFSRSPINHNHPPRMAPCSQFGGVSLGAAGFLASASNTIHVRSFSCLYHHLPFPLSNLSSASQQTPHHQYQHSTQLRVLSFKSSLFFFCSRMAV